MTATEERIQAITNKWFIREPLLLMTLMSHQMVQNKALQCPMRCGQGKIEYGADSLMAALTDEALEETLKAEVIRILLRHAYRHYNGEKHTAYMASNITLNERYKFKTLKYKVADFWTRDSYSDQNFEFYYRALRNLSETAGAGNLSDKGKSGRPGNDDDFSENDDDFSENGDDFSENDGDLSENGDDFSENGDDLSENDGDFSENGDDMSENDGDFSENGDDLSDNGDDFSDNGDDLSEDGDGQPKSGEADAKASNSKGNSLQASAKSQPRSSHSGAEAEAEAQAAALWDEDDYVEQQIKEIIEWASMNRSWGSLSKNMAQTLVASLKPKIDYRKVLNGFRASVLSSRQALTRFKPSRRYGFEYMGKKAQFVTSLLVGVDVSGSISDQEVQLFYSTINRFFKYGIKSIDVQQFDDVLKGEPVTLKKAMKKVRVQGRGGTCFQPLIDSFTASLRRYDGLIIFTDGYAEIPQIRPLIARKMLWICNSEENYRRHQKWMKQNGRCCWIKEL